MGSTAKEEVGATEQSNSSFVEVTSSRRRCCGHRRRRYAECKFDTVAKHRRRSQCDCDATEIDDAGGKLEMFAKTLYSSWSGGRFTGQYTVGKAVDRSMPSFIQGRCSSEVFVGQGDYIRKVRAQTGLDVDSYVDFDWYGKYIFDANVNEAGPVCVSQIYVRATDGCGLQGELRSKLVVTSTCFSGITHKVL